MPPWSEVQQAVVMMGVLILRHRSAGVTGPPVPRDINAPCHPHVIVALHMIEEFHQPSKAGRTANQTAMQPDRHHFWRGGPFSIQRVKRINQIACKLVTCMEPCAVAKRMSLQSSV